MRSLSVVLLIGLCACDASRGPLTASDVGSVATPPPARLPQPIVTKHLPPISGGGLLLLHDGRFAVSDADGDRLFFAPPPSTWFFPPERTSRPRPLVVPLHVGDEPGRLVEDAAGRVHVVLRGGGAIVDVDDKGALLGRRPVCPAPRGIAYDDATDLLHVACATGEVVSLPAGGGPPVRTIYVDDDLRDIVVTGSSPTGTPASRGAASRGTLHVSRFHAAELIDLAADGSIFARRRPPDFVEPSVRDSAPFIAEAAYRIRALSDGSVVMGFQRADIAPIALNAPLPTVDAGASSPQCVGYGCSSQPDGPVAVACQSVVHGAVALFDSVGSRAQVSPRWEVSLPVDLLPVEAGTLSPAVLVDGSSPNRQGNVKLGGGVELHSPSTDCLIPDHRELPAALLAGEVAPNGDLVFLSRNPLRLTDLLAGEILLADDIPVDEGRELFHRDAGSGIACASCHLEGGDDGRVWQFLPGGPRRTMWLSTGNLDGRAPFHWDGSLPDLGALLDDVLVHRMGGAAPSPSETVALGRWLDGLAPPSRAHVADAGAVARGRALFYSPSVGCGDCHRGALFTSDRVVDVGTGGAFKVPSLVGVALHPPYLHDGCAATLADRFGPCGGGDAHGHTSQLDARERADLLAFLASL